MLQLSFLCSSQGPSQLPLSPTHVQEHIRELVMGQVADTSGRLASIPHVTAQAMLSSDKGCVNSQAPPDRDLEPGEIQMLAKTVVFAFFFPNHLQ